MKVTIDGQPVYECVRIDGWRWNGWAIPYFTLDEAKKIIKDMENERDIRGQVTEDGKVVIIDLFDFTHNGFPLEECTTVYEPNEEGLYDIGGAWWCWTEAETEDGEPIEFL